MKQSGMALLMIFFILLLLSVNAVIINGYWFSIFQLTTTHSFQQQAKWTLAGAEDILKDLLMKELLINMTRNNYVINTHQQIILDNEMVNAEIFDATTCFNLNVLSATSNDKVYIEKILENLIYNLGIPMDKIGSIIYAIKDWIDSDNILSENGAEIEYYTQLIHPFLPRNADMYDISELRLIKNINADIFRILKSSFCVLQEKNLKINVNSLTLSHAHLLSALFLGDINKKDALTIIRERPLMGWESIESFMKVAKSKLIQGSVNYNENKIINLISINSNYFHSLLSLNKEGHFYQLRTLYKITNQQPAIVRRQYGVSE